MKYIIAGIDKQSSIDFKKILDCYEIFHFQGSFHTLEETENSIRGESSDIAFIGMDKAELNAFKLANLVRELNPSSKIIFLSSHMEYAVEAFEWDADGFLSLPFKNKQIKHLLLKSI